MHDKCMDEIEVGRVIHYFDKASVAVIELKNDKLNVGDSIHIKGQATDIHQKVESMQLDHKQVESVEASQEVAVKVSGKCHRNDKVYKIV